MKKSCRRILKNIKEEKNIISDIQTMSFKSRRI